MSEWMSDELEKMGATEELRIAPRRRDDLYVRSWRGSAAIDAAYHSKYDRYGPGIVGSVVCPDAEAVTIKLMPRATA